MEGHRLLAGHGDMLLRRLNGGGGIAGTLGTITDRSGASGAISMQSRPETINELIESCNQELQNQGVAAHLERNASNHGLRLVDDTGLTTGVLSANGNLASALGIVSTSASDRIEGMDLQHQSIAEHCCPR